MEQRPAVEDVLPMTPLQEGLLFHANYDDGPDVYVAHTTVDLEGPVRPERLREAVTRLLAGQPALRASFRVLERRGAVQVIQSTVRTPWQEVDLTAEPPDRVDEAAAEVAGTERAGRFALDRAPLIRFTLLRLAEARWRLLVTHHHILLDGWSIPLLMHELFRHYAADGVPLPAGVSPKNFFTWLASQDRDQARSAWQDELAGLESGTMVAEHATLAQAGAPGEVVTRLSATTTAALTTSCRQLGVTVNTAVQTAWALLLAEWTGREDVVFGAVVAGRPPEVSGIGAQLGLFVNTVPVRLTLPSARTVGDLLTGLQDRQSRLSAHQHLGLTDIRQLARIDGDLFDTVVVFENYPVDAAALDLPDGLRVTDVSGRSPMHYPLSLIAEPGRELTLRLGYRPGLVGPDRVTRLAGRLTHLLGVLAGAAPTTPLGRLDLLGAVERERALAVASGEVVTAPSRPIPEAFAHQVATRPDDIAVVSGDVQLSYAEFGSLVDEVAGALRDHGVGPEDLVAICAERGPEVVAAMLAVLQVGAAYLPLDPGYPPDRLGYLLADGRPVLVLTTDAARGRLPADGTPRVPLPTLAPVGA
ncbi:condensation domain-containing protein [Micromonospora violae]|uniref:condensation domain-containing protein n=1 Tax=Micromonospora violae TaxID=1278207 RepID=UPI0033D0FFAF